MVYKNAFVVVAKCNGRILRDQDGTVTLPFGSEYSLLLRNQKGRRAVVKITIDNENATDTGLVLGSNSSFELEGFMRGSEVRKRFRFIQKTQEIIEHRGDRLEDGFIRVEFQFERPRPEVIETHRHHYDHHHHDHHWPRPWYEYRPPVITWGSTSRPDSTWKGASLGEPDTTAVRGGYESRSFSGGLGGQLSAQVNAFADAPVPNADEGITVEGSDTHQHFTSTHVGALEANKHVIVLKLRGTTPSGIVAEKPVTVRDKVTCRTCGHTFKFGIKFCSNCGTSLT